ncbi:hypothetical protein [Streptomyces sp. NBC_00286]|uniref:hypothetical protein n=1 Tax=Streptomyces sp. NBC_00286 TaxID=2975701 RepID=UPI002E2C0DD6|nr:hypothetical protein [Streptomyces sp. NBC_00286]
MKKSYGRAAVAGVGVAVAGSALLMLGVVAPAVLVGYFGFNAANAAAAYTAIMAGMSIAAALSVFGGVTAAGGWALFLLRQAIATAGKKAVVR